MYFWYYLSVFNGKPQYMKTVHVGGYA